MPKTKTCARTTPKPCNVTLDEADPHDMCIAYNTSCFQNYTYDPRGCEHCHYIFSTYNEGSKDVFNARLNAMRRSFKYAFNSNKEKLSAEARTIYENSNGKDVFTAEAKHLDPRPRGSATPSHLVTCVTLPVLGGSGLEPEAEPNPGLCLVLKRSLTLTPLQSQYLIFSQLQVYLAHPYRLQLSLTLLQTTN